MKILILSCSTGEGHNSAAKALFNKARELNMEAVIADPVGFGGDTAKNIVADLYNNTIKTAPKLFGAVYKIGELYDKTNLRSPVYYANSLYAKRLGEYIQKEGFDAVISTHLYGMEALFALRQKGISQVKSYGVLTDYVSIPFFCEAKIDGYFVPKLTIKPQMIKKGVDKDKIFETGIPVGDKFANSPDKYAAREALDIPQDKKVYLIMSGGVGCSKISEICSELVKREKGDYQAYIITGRNLKIKANLQSRYSGNDKIKVLGFTEKVNLYMKAADAVITKPGGLSSTEIAVCTAPMVHLELFAGCESKNAEYFAKNKLSLFARNTTDAVKKAHYLASNPKVAEKMKNNQQKTIPNDSAYQILKKIEESL